LDWLQFVHVPSRFAPDAPTGIGYMAMAANFAEGIVPSTGGCGCSHCTVYNECQMGGLMHPTGGVYGMNVQKIRLCGPALNTSCDTPPRPTLEAEARWVPPTLADFERAAVAAGHRLDDDDVDLRRDDHEPDAAEEDSAAAAASTVFMGVDVDSNTPRTKPPSSFSSCRTSPASCAPTLLGEWAKLGAAPAAALPAKPHVLVARLWTELVGEASFDTAVGFFAPPPNNTAIPPPPCVAPGLAPSSKCVRVLGFRGMNLTSTVLAMVNLHPINTYVDKGDTGRDLYYLHRKQWQLTVPTLDSKTISLNGKPLPAGGDSTAPLMFIEPLGLAGNAAKAALSLPPLSITFVELGLVPALGLAAAAAA
jgi:hypothetical protein